MATMLWVVLSPHLPHHDSTSPPTPSLAAGARRSCDHDTPVMRRSSGAPPPAARSGVHPAAQRALGLHLLAGRQRLQHLAVATRQAIDARVRRRDDVALVLSLLRQV